ncbi:unnamed protein product, partial [Oppiella nova]
YAIYRTENLADVWTDITETLKKVDKLLAKRRGNEKFLSGAALPGLVDYAIWPFIERLPQSIDIAGHNSEEFLRKELPAVHDYRKQLLADPTVQKVSLPYEQLLAHTREYLTNDNPDKVYKKGDPFPARADPNLLRLYNVPHCQFCERVRLVLAAKGIEHEVINVNLKDKPEWLLDRNPSGKVPVLEIGPDSQILTESLIISEYLDEAYPDKQRLQPEDAFQRATDRLFIETFGAKNTVIKHLYVTENLADKWTDIMEGLTALNKVLSNRRWIHKFISGAEQPCLADYMVWPLIQGLVVLVDLAGQDREELMPKWLPALYDYWRQMPTDPTVQKVCQPHEALVARNRDMRSKIFKK